MDIKYRAKNGVRDDWSQPHRIINLVSLRRQIGFYALVLVLGLQGLQAYAENESATTPSMTSDSEPSVINWPLLMEKFRQGQEAAQKKWNELFSGPTESQSSSSSPAETPPTDTTVDAQVHSDVTPGLNAKATASSNPVDSCVRARIVLDMGSANTKARSGVVDICHQKILAEIAKKSMAIPFKDHLSQQPISASGKREFTPEFMGSSFEQIKILVEGLESETQKLLKTEPSLAKFSLLADTKIERAGVATAAFREAGNAPWFVWKVGKDLATKISVIEQSVEGHLGFLSAMVVLNLKHTDRSVDPKDMISWDIGGGSMQIVGYQGVKSDGTQDWKDFPAQWASVPAKQFLFSTFKSDVFNATPQQDRMKASFNPLITTSPETVAFKTDRLTIGALFRQKSMTELAPLLNDPWVTAPSVTGQTKLVYGIGGLHKGILLALRKHTGYENANGYTIENLDKVLLQNLLSKSDEEIADFYFSDGKTERKDALMFAKSMPSNVLLVKSSMEALKLNAIEVIDADNTYGTMVSPQFWDSKWPEGNDKASLISPF